MTKNGRFHVKHPEEVANLTRQLADLRIEVRAEALDNMVEYVLLLLESNKRINLTRITSVDDALRLHIADSLTALPFLAEAPDGPVLDLGSGGGFPGVPIALASSRHVVLLDSVGKKAAAVTAVLAGLEDAPGIDVQAGRAEEFALGHGEQYAVVVARAVAPLPSLVELAAPLLMDQGLLIALKGCPEPAERESGAAVGRMVGLSEVACAEFALAAGEQRTIVVYRKTGSAKVVLPRRTGLAQHNPLA